MHDPRIDSLARQLIGYSVDLKHGERILLDLYDVPESIGIALIREVRRKKGIPVVRIHQSLIGRELLMGATEEQYQLISRQLLSEMKEMDAYVAVRGSHNITETSDVTQKTVSYTHLTLPTKRIV